MKGLNMVGKKTKKSTRGGARKNCGRKPLPPELRKQIVRFYLMEKQAEEVRAFVEQLLSRQ